VVAIISARNHDEREVDEAAAEMMQEAGVKSAFSSDIGSVIAFIRETSVFR